LLETSLYCKGKLPLLKGSWIKKKKREGKRPPQIQENIKIYNTMFCMSLIGRNIDCDVNTNSRSLRS
jgi:hypothetical protein